MLLEEQQKCGTRTKEPLSLTSPLDCSLSSTTYLETSSGVQPPTEEFKLSQSLANIAAFCTAAGIDACIAKYTQ